MLPKALTLTSALVGLATAQSYLNQSAPFNLVLSSTANSTLNGAKLGACHSGAAIQSLCLYDSDLASFYTFYFNTTVTPANATAPPPGSAEYGLLTWTLTDGATPPSFAFNEPLTLWINPASNLAFPFIWPDVNAAQDLAFTAAGELTVPAADENDAVDPPRGFETGEVTLFTRWAVCKTYWEGYTYTALQWVLGDQPPQNPTCDAVTVTRVFL